MLLTAGLKIFQQLFYFQPLKIFQPHFCFQPFSDFSATFCFQPLVFKFSATHLLSTTGLKIFQQFFYFQSLVFRFFSNFFAFNRFQIFQQIFGYKPKKIIKRFNPGGWKNKVFQEIYLSVVKSKSCLNQRLKAKSC